MVKEVTRYTCEQTGRVFDTEEDALRSERDSRAMQYLRDRTGVDETDAYDILTCITQRPDLFEYLMPQHEDIS